jgi:cell division transport system permease protein
MIYQERPYQRRRITSYYVTSVISITLVLFMLGLLGILVVHAHKLSKHVKENIGFTVMVDETVEEGDILALTDHLRKQSYIKQANYISREQAAQEFSRELGEDFVDFLGYNPLLPTIELRMKADYANNDSLRIIEAQLLEFPEIKEVDYHKSLVNEINRNIRQISLVILGFSLLLLLIAVVLINNTIRLSVYARRFLIRSMQLVGATERFIQKPFMWKAVLQGFISGLIAVGLLAGVLYFVAQEIPEVLELQDLKILGLLFACIILLGMFISWFSTIFSVRKYIRMKTESLYH